MASQTGFTVGRVIEIFTRYKALCQLMASKDLDISQGIDFAHFQQGIPDLQIEDDKFARRLFEIATQDARHGQCSPSKLKFAHFLNAVTAISAPELDKRIDLFFRIVDQDGNGNLDIEEV